MVYDFGERTEKNIVESIIENAKESKESFSLYISEDLDYDESLELLFGEESHYMYHYLKKAAENSGIKINYQDNIFVEDRNSRGITVKLQIKK